MKKQKHFYTHLVETSTISLSLAEGTKMSHGERMHLISLADETIYHAIVDAVLSELSEPDKKIFLLHLSMDEHDKIWELLLQKIVDVEEKIKLVAEQIKKELHNDIKEVKKKRV